MASQQQHYAPQGHYSGRNKIPNIKEFVTNLDKEKAERDKQLDEQAKQRQAEERAARKGQPPPQQSQQPATSDAQDHQVVQGGVKGTQKQVTDPTTGRRVVIEDVNKETMKNVMNPTVCCRRESVTTSANHRHRSQFLTPILAKIR